MIYLTAFSAVVGFAAGFYGYWRSKNIQLALGIWYFSLMEVLLTLASIYAAPELHSELDGNCGGSSANKYTVGKTKCDSYENKLLTILIFLHFCFQPYFYHLINFALTDRCKFKERYSFVLRQCLLGGCLIFARYYFSILPSFRTMDLRREPSTEWFHGRYLCTFQNYDMKFLGWSVPLSDPSYFLPSVSLHGFLLFSPFITMYDQPGKILEGLFLLLTGPVAAMYLSKNLMEQASIWNYFFLVQIIVYFFFIREVFVCKPGMDRFHCFRKYKTKIVILMTRHSLRFFVKIFSIVNIAILSSLIFPEKLEQIKKIRLK